MITVVAGNVPVLTGNSDTDVSPVNPDGKLHGANLFLKLTGTAGVKSQLPETTAPLILTPVY